MKRAVLPLVTLGLFAMILADRVLHTWGSRSPAVLEATSESRPATVALRPADAAARNTSVIRMS